MPPTTRQQSREARIIPRFERLVTRATERQRTMNDGWRAFSEAYLMPRRDARRGRVRQFFAATIKRVVIGRRAVRAILQYMADYDILDRRYPGLGRLFYGGPGNLNPNRYPFIRDDFPRLF
jgi:hypothetical protein